MKTLLSLFFLLLLLPSSSIALEKHLPLAQEGFTSAKVCGQCHVAIYEGWKGSMHANAVTDPIFYTIFLETSRETGGKTDALCLSCHAPTTRVTKDWALKKPVTMEGVTCDFCHSVKKTNLSAANRFDLEVGHEKWGPLKDVSSPVHKASYSSNFEKAQFCGGCHEFTSSRGVPILETYSEWKQSPQAKQGLTCQTCHMPKIKGLVVPTRVKPTNEVYIHSHEAAGGHTVAQVQKAVTIRMGNVTRKDNKVHAVVLLKNVGAGHKVPTGLPTRKLVLLFKASLNGTSIYDTKRVFQKTLVNKNGEVITKDADVFLKAVKIKQDNRLKPGEERAEHFSFFAPEGKSVTIETKAYYLYQPQLIQETEMKIDLGQEKVVVPRK